MPPAILLCLCHDASEIGRSEKNQIYRFKRP